MSLGGCILSHSLGFLATQLAITLYDDFMEVVTEYNVTVRQCGVLFIAMHVQLPQTKLSKMMRVDKNIVVSMIDNLEEKGMVKRVKNQKNRKENLICLTPNGQKIAQKLHEKMQKRQREILGFLSDEDFTKLHNILEDIYQNFLIRRSNENSSDGHINNRS